MARGLRSIGIIKIVPNQINFSSVTSGSAAGNASHVALNSNSELVLTNPLDHDDFFMFELSTPGVNLQTSTNVFRFNCPYKLQIKGLDLFLDQHSSSGDVTVTVTNTTDTNLMISLSVAGTATTANTTTVTNPVCDAGDIVTFAITATPSNAQGLRANLKIRRVYT